MNRATWASLIITIAAISLFIWAFKATSGDWAAIASLVQAGVATALVWATWGSISRADQQIEKANEQIALLHQQFEVLLRQTRTLEQQVDIAERQIGLRSEPQILVTVNPQANEDSGGIEVEIINLSGFGIHVSGVVVEALHAYPVRRALKLIKRNLQPSEYASALLMSREEVAALDVHVGGPVDGDPNTRKYEDMLSDSDHYDWFPMYSLAVEYYYGPTGAGCYLSEYKFSLYRMAKTVAIERYWRIELKQTTFARMVGDGSWMPLYGFTQDGERRPLDW